MTTDLRPPQPPTREEIAYARRVLEAAGEYAVTVDRFAEPPAGSTVRIMQGRQEIVRYLRARGSGDLRWGGSPSIGRSLAWAEILDSLAMHPVRTLTHGLPADDAEYDPPGTLRMSPPGKWWVRTDAAGLLPWVALNCNGTDGQLDRLPSDITRTMPRVDYADMTAAMARGSRE